MKLKSLLKKLLSAECTPQDVLFVLTFWGIALYVLGSVYFLLWALNLLPLPDEPRQCIYTITGGITLSVIWTLGRFYYQISFQRKWLHCLFWPMLGLSLILPTAGVIYLELTVDWALIVLLSFWVLAWLLLPRVKWYCILGDLICLAGGILIVLTILGNIRDPLIYDSTRGTIRNVLTDDYGPNWTWSISQTLNLSGNGWVWFSLLGVALLAAGYLLSAKIFADAAKLPFRRMFGKGVCILWSLAAATYLLFLAMAMIASHRASQNVQRLEQRFGHPMTMAALGQQYYRGDRPDKAFWDNLERLRAPIYPLIKHIDFFDTPPGVIRPGEKTVCRERFALIDEALTRWEDGFAADIPPNERDYRPGKWSEIDFPSKYLPLTFNRMELWRIYFALADNRPELALQAYQRIRHVNDSLLRESEISGILAWYDCKNFELDALQLLLESGKLSFDDLQAIAAGLTDTEKRMPAMREQALYGTAMGFLDLLDLPGYGFRQPPGAPATPPLASLRLFLPQAWWYFAVAKTYIAQYFNSPDFNRLSRQCDPPKIFYPASELTYRQDILGIRFDRLTARLRAAQTVIRAIEYKQKYGRYPGTLDDLPLDPFTDQPMHYHVGEWQIEQTYFIVPKDWSENQERDDWWYGQPQTDTVPAVISWSVGPDHKDDQGKSRRSTSQRPDDTAFIVRIKP